MTQLKKICTTHFDNVCHAGVLLCHMEILFLQQRLFARLSFPLFTCKLDRKQSCTIISSLLYW